MSQRISKGTSVDVFASCQRFSYSSKPEVSVDWQAARGAHGLFMGLMSLPFLLDYSPSCWSCVKEITHKGFGFKQKLALFRKHFLFSDGVSSSCHRRVDCAPWMLASDLIVLTQSWDGRDRNASHRLKVFCVKGCTAFLPLLFSASLFFPFPAFSIVTSQQIYKGFTS